MTRSIRAARTLSALALALPLAFLSGCKQSSHEVTAHGVSFTLSSDWKERSPDREERVLYARRDPGLMGMVRRSSGTMWVNIDRQAHDGWTAQTAAHWQTNLDGFQKAMLHQSAQDIFVENSVHPSACVASFLPGAYTLACAIEGTPLTLHYVGSSKGRQDVLAILRDLH